MTPIRTWWGAAWVEKMERLAESRRFAEGDKYARTGRVQDLSFDGRILRAKVQGSDELPYTVRISFDPFAPEQWTALLAGIRDRASLLSQLSSGELPLEIRASFSKANLRFMPERYVDLHLECSCPDWLKPCKHLVALWLRFAREFDRDPFLLFRLRGLSRDEFFAMLGGQVQGADPELLVDDADEEEIPDHSVPLTPESLPADPAAFWSAPPLPDLAVETTGRSLLDGDIFLDLKRWAELEPQFQQIYDAVWDLAGQIRS
jgi:uncharacterized Zn finger protein